MQLTINNTIKRVISFDDVIFLFLNVIVLIDLINGYFINIGYHLPIAQVYKMLLIGLLLFRLIFFLKIDKRVLFIVVYTLFFIFYYLVTEGIDLLSDTIVHLTKLGFIVLTFVYFSNGIIKNQSFFINKLIFFAKISLFFFIISLLFGVFGFGFSSYSDQSVGNKSFFNGANDLGVALVTLFSFFIFYTSYINYKKNIKYLFFIFLVSLSISVATKMLILGTILSLIILPYKVKSKNLKPVKKIKLFLIFAPLVIVILFTIGYLISKTEIFERLQNYYQLNDLLFVIFSGRLIYLENNINVFFNSNFIIQFFGLGGDRTIELDFFDVLFNYGYFGLIWVYGFYSSLYVNAYQKSKSHLYPFAPYVLFINIVLTFVSLLSGHVLFSAMGGIFISLVNALAFYKGNLKEDLNIR